jgi:nucleoside-diphosphate-sugar epimerase
MKVAVTGAAGLLGRAVVAELREAGHIVRAIDCRQPGGMSEWLVDADLRDGAAAEAAVADCEAVAHLAAWPTPYAADPRDVWTDNLAMTTNVLFAATAQKIDRIVYASSQSALGLAWAKMVVAPDYVPVDESHPCRPSDCYSASKLAGEHLLRAFTSDEDRSGFALRFPAIWKAEQFETFVRRRLDNPEQGAKSQWAYVDSRDAARLVRLTLECGMNGYHLLNGTAPQVFVDRHPDELIAQWYPNLWDLRLEPGKLSSVFDHRAAERLLGFRARYIWGRNGITDTSVL